MAPLPCAPRSADDLALPTARRGVPLGSLCRALASRTLLRVSHMLFRKTSPMVACLCVLALHASAAQTRPPAPPFTQSLAITGGFTINDHLDASSSPIPFSGTGLDSRFRYQRSFGRWNAIVEGEGARRTYSSRADAGTSVHERAYDGSFTTSLLRGFSSSSAFSAGLALDVRGGVLTHHYADPGATTTSYVNGYATLGPAVRWQHSALGGNTFLGLSVPLVGIAHHPYTDVRIDQASPSFNAVTLANLRGYNFTAGFETSARRRLGLIGEFHANALDYADIQRARTVTTGFNLGVVLRFGRTPR